MMIKISMSSGTNNDHTHMIFVDLAGFEPIGSNDIKSTKFINSTLSSLSTVLLSMTNSDVVTSFRSSVLTKNI